MAAVAQPAVGATLSYALDGTTYVAVGLITSISGVGGGEMGKRDTTVLSSTLHTARPTIPTKGPVKFGILFDPTDSAHQAVRDMATTPATVTGGGSDPLWKVVFSITATPHTCVFTGFVESFDGANAEDVDGNLEAEVSLHVNTVPVWS